METYWERLEKRFGRRVEEARPAVERFLATHPKEDFYPVTFEDPDSDFELTCLVKLSDEELDRMKVLSEEFDDPWKEYPELMGRLLDEEVPPAPTSICWEVKSIGLSPEHSYLFTMAVFKDGPDKSPETKRFYIQLADEEYAAILAWSFIHDKNGDGRISFNIMRQDLPELFDKISIGLELSYYDCLFRLMDCPYAVFMDEADQDLAMIKKGI